MLESALDAVVCADRDGLIRLVNASAEELYDCGREELLGTPVARLFADEAADAGRDVVARVLAGARIVHLPTRHRRSDGSVLDVSIGVSPIAAEDGEPDGISLFVRDIAGQVAVKEELARTRAILEEHAVELQRSNADLEQFGYVASHDLSEPLRTITGMLALLTEEHGDALDAEAQDYVARATAGAERLRMLIAGLLQYSRVGRERPERVAVALDEVLAEVVAALDETLGDRGATVRAAGALPVVQGDAAELGQVLQNLIANAVKFSDGPAPVVDVSAEEDGTACTVTVEDDGIGIPEQHAERVFRPFKRLHTRERYTGSGVGLAICRRIVERHGGRIWIEPGTPQGTRVRFTLPVAEAV